MKPLNTRDPFKVGLVAIAVGALVAVGIVVLSLASFGTSTYTAVIQHTAGLRTGEDVQVHGVSVGEVRSIELGETDVRVTFTLDREIELGSTTTAEVKVATLLGTHYLQVDPEGGGALADDTIPLERTAVPFNLQDVIEEGTENLEELDAKVLARALSEAADVLEVSSDDIGPALMGVSRLSEVVADRSEQTGALLRAARGVTDQLSASSDDILGLMRQTNLVVSEITARREAISRLLRETRVLAESLTAIVTETRADVQPALDDLNLALDSLNTQDESLQRVLTALGPAMRYIANATGSAPVVNLFLQDPALIPDDARCSLGNGRNCR